MPTSHAITHSRHLRVVVSHAFLCALLRAGVAAAASDRHAVLLARLQAAGCEGDLLAWTGRDNAAGAGSSAGSAASAAVDHRTSHSASERTSERTSARAHPSINTGDAGCRVDHQVPSRVGSSVSIAPDGASDGPGVGASASSCVWDSAVTAAAAALVEDAQALVKSATLAIARASDGGGGGRESSTATSSAWRAARALALAQAAKAEAAIALAMAAMLGVDT